MRSSIVSFVRPATGRLPQPSPTVPPRRLYCRIAGDTPAADYIVQCSEVDHRAPSLPGTATIIVRTHSGLCRAALTNTRRRQSGMEGHLDRLVWVKARKVAAWNA
jgi:hypothetical protein